MSGAAQIAKGQRGDNEAPSAQIAASDPSPIRKGGARTMQTASGRATSRKLVIDPTVVVGLTVAIDPTLAGGARIACGDSGT